MHNSQLCKYVHLFAVQHFCTLVRDKDKQSSVTIEEGRAASKSHH
jgi:hypothetical protein